MAVITIPSIRAASVTMQLVRQDRPLKMMDGGEVIVKTNAATWVVSVQRVVEKLDAVRDWQSALAQLSDLTNTFKLTPPSWVSGTGFGGANPLVVGAGQLGTSLNCDGAGSTAISLEGDFIEVNNEFKILTADATSSGGLVTFNFEPALRQAPANNATVDVKTPQITLRLANPIASWSARIPDFYNIEIQAVESYGP